jgi:hypothetical protein
LRQAATALISTAAAPVVLAALRTLLADPEFAWDTPDLPSGPAPPPRPEPHPESPEWEDLRLRIRAAKTARSVTNKVLADELGIAVSSVNTALSTRRPPTKALQLKLEGWLANEPDPAPAPEVVVQAATFRGNGTSRVHTDAGIGLAAAADHSA